MFPLVSAKTSSRCLAYAASRRSTKYSGTCGQLAKVAPTTSAAAARQKHKKKTYHCHPCFCDPQSPRCPFKPGHVIVQYCQAGNGFYQEHGIGFYDDNWFLTKVGNDYHLVQKCTIDEPSTAHTVFWSKMTGWT
jgi:hypothetical protein